MALGSVFRESKTDFMPLSEFESATDSIYARERWTMPGPLQVLSWGLRQVGILGDGSDKLLVGRYVAVKCLEDAAKVLAERSSTQATRVERVISKKEFANICNAVLSGGKTMSSDDIDVMLKYLARDTRLVAHNGKTVKFRENASSKVEITTEDEAIAELKDLLTSLSLQVETLNNRVEQLTLQAKAYVEKGNRVAAMGILRSKKIVETSLTKQTAALNQLEEVYIKIGQAADQVELVRVLEGSTGILKKLNAEVGGVERVDNIVDELKEQMVQVDEINNVIVQVDQIDEGEVNDELTVMEAEEVRRREDIKAKEKKAREAKKTADLETRFEALEAETKRAKENRTEASGKVEAVVDESATALKRLSIEPVAD